MEEQKKQPKHINLRFLILALVLIGGLIGGYYFYKSKKDEQPASSSSSVVIPSGWSLFKDTKYGVEFIYPESWGKAQMNEIVLKKGRSYTVSFTQGKRDLASSLTPVVTIVMDSEDAENSSCPEGENCEKVAAKTKETLLNDLSSIREERFKLDESSYAVFLPSQDRISSGVTVHHVVDLSKINVSAVKLNYYLLGPKTECSISGPEDKNGCISNGHLDAISDVLKSVKSI